MIDLQKMTNELKIDEGFRDKVYTCSAGKLTIGYGWNLEDNPMSERLAEMKLQEDIAHTIAQCERFPWFYPLDGVRKRVIINMVFNMGFGSVSSFRRMITAIENQDWSEAAKEMRDSRWHSQVGQRAERLCLMMETGEDGH